MRLTAAAFSAASNSRQPQHRWAVGCQEGQDRSALCLSSTFSASRCADSAIFACTSQAAAQSIQLSQAASGQRAQHHNLPVEELCFQYKAMLQGQRTICLEISLTAFSALSPVLPPRAASASAICRSTSGEKPTSSFPVSTVCQEVAHTQVSASHAVYQRLSSLQDARSQARHGWVSSSSNRTGQRCAPRVQSARRIRASAVARRSPFQLQRAKAHRIRLRLLCCAFHWIVLHAEEHVQAGDCPLYPGLRHSVLCMRCLLSICFYSAAELRFGALRARAGPPGSFCSIAGPGSVALAAAARCRPWTVQRQRPSVQRSSAVRCWALHDEGRPSSACHPGAHKHTTSIAPSTDQR